VWETDSDLTRLQALLDRSMASAGEHLASIITDERRLGADDLCRRLTGMRLLSVATVTADGRPISGAVDGYFIRGEWHFSTGAAAVRTRHLRARPFVSATHLPGEQLQVSVHGSAEVYDFNDPAQPELKRAMLDHYLPLQGPSFEEWLDSGEEMVGVRIAASKMFTFAMDPPT